MRSSSFEKDPLLRKETPVMKTGGHSSFNLEDDTVIMQGNSLPPRFVKSPSSYGEYSAGGRTTTKKDQVGPDSRFWSMFKSKQMDFMLLISYFVVVVWTLLVVLGPMVLYFVDRAKWCELPLNDGKEDDDDSFERALKRSGDQSSSEHLEKVATAGKYDNPDYNTDPCRYQRLPFLAGLTLEECDYCQRMLVSVLLGGAIGYERRSSDRPAGIRTMGLVSLGACFFTLSSLSAFKSSTMGWDSSRVTAALPSGVGFLGAALIWKGTVNVDDQELHQVHGLTTAASVWLSAAIGVGAGGALYFVSVYSTVLILLVLRFGPKLYLHEEDDEDEWQRAKEQDAQPPANVEGEETLQAVDFNKSDKNLLKVKRRPTVPTFHG